MRAIVVVGGLLLLGSGPVLAKPPGKPGTQCDCSEALRDKVSAIEEMVKVQEQELERITRIERSLDLVRAELEKSLEVADAPGIKAQTSVATERGRVRVRMAGELLFLPGSARITRAGRQALAEVGAVLGSKVVGRIEVAGHTDGSPPGRKYQDNWQLSCERARRVAALLSAAGVDRRRLVAAGYADGLPVESADTQQARAANRRVELWIDPSAEPAASR